MAKIKPYKVKRCILKDNLEIRQMLRDRFKELELSFIDISNDACSLGQNIPISMLSRYMKRGNTKGTLSQEDIMWLCYRYGISFSIKPEILPYNAKKCIESLKMYFK